MLRKEEIEKAASQSFKVFNDRDRAAFIDGAEWANRTLSNNKSIKIFAFLRNNPFYTKAGQYNGYVAFDATIPIIPLSYQGMFSFEQDIPNDYVALDNIVNVHGGITFDRMLDIKLDMIPLTEIPNPNTFKKYRVIGFDTSHAGDNRFLWNYDTVKEETMNLYNQIKTLLNNYEQI